jgi:hypothetical protein
MRMRVSRAAVALIAMLGISCGGDGGTGPNVTYPTLPAAFVAALCVRQGITNGQSINGTISSSDCDSGGSYFEVYQVKVQASGSYDIAMNSGAFDTYLELVVIDSIVGNNVYLTGVAFDDDSGTGLNALIAGIALSASADYLLAAAGYDYTEVGSYTLSIQ